MAIDYEDDPQAYADDLAAQNAVEDAKHDFPPQEEPDWDDDGPTTHHELAEDLLQRADLADNAPWAQVRATQAVARAVLASAESAQTAFSEIALRLAELRVTLADHAAASKCGWDRVDAAIAGIGREPSAENEPDNGPRRYWAIWSGDRHSVVGVVSGHQLTSADAALRYACSDAPDYEWTKAHSFVEEVDSARFDDLIGWDAKTEDAKARLRPSLVGSVSPTDPAALGEWLRALPHRSILRDQSGDPCLRETGMEHGFQSVRHFPALFILGDAFEISADRENNVDDLARYAPFTVLALGDGGAQDGGSDG